MAQWLGARGAVQEHGAEFDTLHPHGCSQLSVTPVPADPAPLLTIVSSCT